MTTHSHNFDPAKAMAYRADVEIDAALTVNGRDYAGTAYFLASGEWELTDSGRREWAADVEFIGAVLWDDDGNTLIVRADEGCPGEWGQRAIEQGR